MDILGRDSLLDPLELVAAAQRGETALSLLVFPMSSRLTEAKTRDLMTTWIEQVLRTDDRCAFEPDRLFVLVRAENALALRAIELRITKRLQDAGLSAAETCRRLTINDAPDLWDRAVQAFR